jgi:hypothetical protein
MNGWLFAVIVLACVSMTMDVADDTRLPAGTWGGDHVVLDVTEAGAHFEFDCASGDVSQPMTTPDDGKLDVEGVLVRQRPGPIRIGEERPRQRARYSGRLTKNSLTFDVTLVDSNEQAGHFTVVLGEAGRLRKCR